ncbi:MAG: DUF4177 domain-containing protein [Aliishimia sp.]
MARYEYSVIPAPSKGVKAKGVRSTEARFAHGLQELMNQMGAEGWEYQRAETLPSTERAGLTGSTTQWRHVLVFRRPLETPKATPLKIEHKQDVAPKPPKPKSAPVAAEKAPDPAATPVPVVTKKEPEPAPKPVPAPATTADDAHPAGQPGALSMQKDNGVEDTSEVSGLTESLATLAKNRKSPFDSDR